MENPHRWGPIGGLISGRFWGKYIRIGITVQAAGPPPPLPDMHRVPCGAKGNKNNHKAHLQFSVERF